MYQTIEIGKTLNSLAEQYKAIASRRENVIGVILHPVNERESRITVYQVKE